MANISIFDKYNNYSKNTILLTIETMNASDKIVLKKYYGSDFLGNGFLYKNEFSNFELVTKKFEKRLKEIDFLLLSGKSKDEIIRKFKDNSLYMLYSSKSNVKEQTNLKETFIENFPSQLQQIISKKLKSLSKEEIEIINSFYWGKKYDILKTEPPKNKINDIRNLINKLSDEAIIENKNKKINEPNSKKSEKPISKKVEKSRPKKSIKSSSKKSENSNKKTSYIKTTTKNKRGFLDYFDENNQEQVLKIVEQFKTTTPNYYFLIHKRYSGDNLEIDNGLIDQKDKETFKSIKKRIKQLLTNPPKSSKLLDYFEENNQEQVLKIIEQFKETNPSYYEVIHKKYSGDNLEIDNGPLEKDEKIVFNSAINTLKKILNNPNITIGFFKNFDNGDHERILKIIEQFKETNPNYYEVIHKKYSGDNLEIDNGPLEKSERIVFENAKARIKQLLSRPEKTLGLLRFFEKEDYERVLKIVEQFKETNPNYYEIIHKKYSGKNLEINNGILIESERKIYESAKARIKQLLSKPEKILGFLEFFEKDDSERVLKIIEQFKETNPDYYYVIYTKYSKNNLEVIKHNLSIKEANLLNLAREEIKKILADKETKENLNCNCSNKEDKINNEIIDFYIKNLNSFSDEQAIEMIKQIAINNPNKIDDIIQSDYFKNKLIYLTYKEQEYIYLTLLSYNNKSLTQHNIARILDVDENVLNEYEVMTNNDKVNVLTKLLKK